MYVCARVWARMPLSVWVPEVACNWDSGYRRHFIATEMLPFTCLSSIYLRQMRNCARHSRVSISYSRLQICLLKTQVVSEGDCHVEQEIPSFICIAPRTCEFESEYELAWNFSFDNFTKGCVYTDSLGNREQLSDSLALSLEFIYCPLAISLSLSLSLPSPLLL